MFTIKVIQWLYKIFNYCNFNMDLLLHRSLPSDYHFTDYIYTCTGYVFLGPGNL